MVTGDLVAIAEHADSVAAAGVGVLLNATEVDVAAATIDVGDAAADCDVAADVVEAHVSVAYVAVDGGAVSAHDAVDDSGVHLAGDVSASCDAAVVGGDGL